ncbi:MAG: hypothetical protein KDD62_03280, partial [Bdellovibrionales bacterium]|nr:hypothetical protein [Bdellovibrionales bacterium]
MNSSYSSNVREQAILNLVDESWLAAGAYVKYAGDISALFSSTVRLTFHSVAQAKKNNADPTQAAFKAAEFLLKVSPTIKSALLRAATDLYGENTEKDEDKHLRKLSPN